MNILQFHFSVIMWRERSLFGRERLIKHRKNIQTNYHWRPCHKKRKNSHRRHFGYCISSFGVRGVHASPLLLGVHAARTFPVVLLLPPRLHFSVPALWLSAASFPLLSALHSPLRCRCLVLREALLALRGCACLHRSGSDFQTEEGV